MRILVLGAGALGGYFGARLLAAGRDVTFLVRPGTAAKLAANGLRITSRHFGDLHLPTPNTRAEGAYDLILISAKAFDLESALDDIAPFVSSQTVVLPLLNGMAHMPVLDRRFGAEHVLGGTCFISATREQDGTIVHRSERAALYFGERAPGSIASLSAITQALTVPGYLSACRTDITQDQWEKWTFIAAGAAGTCLFRASIGDMVAAGADRYVQAIFAECVAITAAAGHKPSPQYIAEHSGFLSEAGSPLKASTLRDIETGGEVEADQLLGDLLARAPQVDAPLLTLAYANLQVYRQRRRQELQATR